MSRAAILHRLGDPQACEAINRLLRTMAVPTDNAFAALAAKIATAGGYNGWVGLTREGRLVGTTRSLSASMDGKPFRHTAPKRLPTTWQSHKQVVVKSSDGPFLGGIFDIRSITLIEGFVEMKSDGTIQGWAYAPHDPDAQLEVEFRREGDRQAMAHVPVTDPVGVLPGTDGFMRVHGFKLPMPFSDATSRIEVRVAGHRLRGGPLSPWPLLNTKRQQPKAAKQRRSNAVALTRLRSAPRSRLPPRAAIDVIVPLYRGAAEFDVCLRSLIKSRPPDVRIICVDDCIVEERLQKLVVDAEAKGHIILLRHATNRGFPAAVNTALSFSAGRDAVILNSDTIVPPDALSRLADAAYSAPAIGTATPLTTDGSRTTCLKLGEAECLPSVEDLIRRDHIARECNRNVYIDLPTCSGFCVFVRHDCLASVGAFEEDVFGHGFCEDQDFSLRARQQGWRHVAACDVVVAHAGGRSFGPSGPALLARNLEILSRLYPGHDDEIEAFRAADPLLKARSSLAQFAWAHGKRHFATILVTHADGGGVERLVADRGKAIHLAGGRAIFIRPTDGYAVSQYGERADPNLVFSTVEELAAFLRHDFASAVEVHHIVSHKPGLEKLGELLGVPTDVFVHDFAPICPQVTLCGRTGHYCGEPVFPEDCDHCVEDIGTKFPMIGKVVEWRSAQASFFMKARQVIAFSIDTARRLHRYMPDCEVHVQPPEEDIETTFGISLPVGLRRGDALRVAITGALGVSKGYNVVLGCARDAKRRGLPLQFTVVGHTIDDRRLLNTNHVFVTGEYDEGKAQDLLSDVEAHVGFLPSVWPETWCFALTELWKAKLPVIAFDIGSQAARIRATAAGSVLPLQLPASAINDFLLSLRRFEEIAVGDLNRRRASA